MLVHRGYHKRNDEQELRVVGRTLARLEDVVTEVGDQRPVVVLAAAVHAREGFFVQQTGHPVLCRHFAHSFHRQLVLVRRDVDGGVDGSKFVLCGGDFVVLGLGKHAEFPQFLVEVFHKRRHAGFNRAEVVVFQLLSLGRFCAEESPAGVHQVTAFFERFAVDEEIFLFGTDCGIEFFRLSAEEAQQSDALAADRFHRAQQGRLFVKRLTVVAAKRGGNAQSVVLDEGVRGRVPRGIAARLESRAQSAAGKRARIGLALYQFLAAELHNHAAVGRGGDERVVLFRGQSRHRLEPMREVSHAFFHRPVLHRVGDDVCGFEREGTVVRAAVLEFLIGVLGQTFAHDLLVEDHTAEQFGHYHKTRSFSAGVCADAELSLLY